MSQTVYNIDGARVVPQFVGYLLGSRTVVTSTGSSTYSPPSGTRAILVECIGGGGGGAAATASTSSNIVVAGGGGGGGYAATFVPILVNPTTYFCTVNAGGNSGVGGSNTSFALPNVGGAGTSTVICQANGGQTGSVLANGSTPGFAAGGAAGSIASLIGDVQFQGQAGQVAQRASGTVAMSGQGGTGPFGAGGGIPVITQSVGNAGGKYGAGGSGGMSVNAGGTAAGGHGGQGVILIWEFY